MPVLARDLYGLAAQRWGDAGWTAHYVVVPAHDVALADAWFRLGVGQQHAHGLREVPAQLPPMREVHVRRAVEADLPALAALEGAPPLHQDRSPVFSSGGAPGARAETGPGAGRGGGRQGHRQRFHQRRHGLASLEPALVAYLAATGFRTSFLRLHRLVGR